MHFSTAVTGLRQAADDGDCAGLSQGGEREFSADYVIGADGARSAVRQAIDVEMSGDIYPETTILATTLFPFHERLEGLSNVSYCWKPDGTFSLLRLPGVWRVSLYARDGQTIEQALKDEAQQDLLHDIVPETRADRGVGERGPTASTSGWPRPIARAVCCLAAMPLISTARPAEWA